MDDEYGETRLSWDRFRRNLARGFDKLVWTARFLADRTAKESLIVREAFGARRIEERIEDAYRRAGKRLVAVRHRESPLADTELEEILDEVEALLAELDERLSKVRTMGGRFEGDEGDGPDAGGEERGPKPE